MKNIATILRKEFSRFFKDKRMILTIILPGLLIYILYSVLGSVIGKISDPDEEFTPTAVVFNMPSEELGLNGIFKISEEQLDIEEAKGKVAEGSLDLVIVFPENFSISGDLNNPPNVSVFYNSVNENSLQSYYMASALLSAYQKTTFTVNLSDKTVYDLATEKDTSTKILSMLVPILMFALLASACMAVAPESIAGEKERGTMATMLITPVKRWQIALGKIISLACFAVLSGISSFLGVILSLPKLMNGMMNITSVPYGFADYLGIFALIISLVLVIVSMFAVVSGLAKSVKEAGAYIGPLMMLIIVLGMVSMFVPSTMVGLCAIPVLGCGLALSGLLSLTASPLGIALAVISNLVFTGLFIVALALMLNSEKIMFKK